MKKFIHLVLLIIVGSLSLFGLMTLLTTFNSNLFTVYTNLKLQEIRLSRSVQMYKKSSAKIGKQVKKFRSKESEYDALIADAEKQKELLSQSVRAVTKVRRNAGMNLPWECVDDFRLAEEEMLRKIDWFRTHPLEDGWYDTLRILSQWTINVPYVNLPHRLFKTPALNRHRGENPPYINELNMMIFFGRVAYTLLNDPDPVKATHHGILEMIELYTNLKGKGVAFEIASVEDYIDLAATGELLGRIDSVSQNFTYNRKPR